MLVKHTYTMDLYENTSRLTCITIRHRHNLLLIYLPTFLFMIRISTFDVLQMKIWFEFLGFFFGEFRTQLLQSKYFVCVIEKHSYLSVNVYHNVNMSSRKFNRYSKRYCCYLTILGIYWEIRFKLLI